MSFTRRHWIAPGPLVYAQLAHGFSWVLIFWAAWSGNFGSSLYGFAWIHTVALAWVTMAALAILVHALPNFIDVRWRGETVARWSLLFYGAGVTWLIFGFLADPRELPFAGALVTGSLIVYLTTAFATAYSVFRGERVQRAVARAFTGTFVFLLATALLGFGLALMLGGRSVPIWIATVPEAHADLGTLGWLSLLIFGVSMRTLRPITGGGTRFRWMHIVVGSLAALGIPLLAAGVSAHVSLLAWIGGGLFGIAAIGFAFDTLDVLYRASVLHRPPQAFVFAAVVWFLIATVLGARVLAGLPDERAYIFVLLAGWVGQIVNAHMYHIGVRLIATIYRGDDDETRPQELLEARLSWFSFISLQIAVGLVTAALLAGDPGLAARGAIFGAGGWIAMVANVLVARERAKHGK
jgi:hypothetical protein